MSKNPVRTGALIAALILFSMFVYLVTSGGGAAQFSAVGALFVFCILATRLDDITNLKFGATGVAAQLEKKLREAEATVQQLQNIAEMFAQLSIQQISASNRLDGMKPAEKREAIAKIETGLEAINLDKPRIKKVLETQFTYDDFDYYHWTMYDVFHSGDKDVVAKREAFKREFPDRGLGSNPPPDEVERFLKLNGWAKGETSERLRDWKQYRRTRKHRRRDEWEARYDHFQGSPTDAFEAALKPEETPLVEVPL